MAGAATAGSPPRHRVARLAWCTLTVALTHALALLGWSGGEALASPRGGVSTAVQLRLIDAESPLHEDRPPAVVPGPASDSTRLMVADTQPVGTRLSSLATGDVVHAPPAVTMPAGPSAPPAAAQTGNADADYLPRTALSVWPRPLAPVAIGYPSFDGEASRYVGEFELFIDDAGAVVRVEPRGSDLPRILIDAVRRAFHAARFVPGEVDGQPVRSRIRIEVSFDSGGES